MESGEDPSPSPSPDLAAGMTAKGGRRPRPTPREIEVKTKELKALRSQHGSWSAKGASWVRGSVQTVSDVSAFVLWVVQGMPQELDPSRKLHEKQARSKPQPFPQEDVSALDLEVLDSLDTIRGLLAKQVWESTRDLTACLHVTGTRTTTYMTVREIMHLTGVSV